MRARRRLRAAIAAVAVSVLVLVAFAVVGAKSPSERLEDAFAPGPCDDTDDIIWLDSLVLWRGSWHVLPDGDLDLEVVATVDGTELRRPIGLSGNPMGVVAGDDTADLALAIPAFALHRLELLADTGTSAIVRTASRGDGSWASVSGVARVLPGGTVDWYGCGDSVFTTPLDRFQRRQFPREPGEQVLARLLGNEPLVARMTADPAWRQPFPP